MDDFFAPLLVGLFLIAAINRALMWWFQERSVRVASAFLFFVCLCLLYLATVLVWLAPAANALRVVLVAALALNDWHEWRDLIAFMRKRDAAQNLAAPPVPTTLQDVAQSDGDAVTLDASPVEPSTETVALDATAKD